MKIVRFLVLLISFSSVYALANDNLINFTQLLSGKITPDNNEALSHFNPWNTKELEQYNDTIKQYWPHFQQSFVEPIRYFSMDKLSSLTQGKSLFYPFSGPDISYPLLLFPEIENYILVGMEFPGNIDITLKTFSLKKFTPQIQEYLERGFFKTMRMSSQIYYNEGVIPVIVAQIGLIGGVVHDITSTHDPYKGIIIHFSYQEKSKTLYYYRANLDDINITNNFMTYILNNKLSDNCMLKASSYKLHQVDFKNLRQFMLENCSTILQDDTGMPLSYLKSKNYNINLFGNYIRSYGDEFTTYNQQDLAKLYEQQKNVE